MPYFTYDTSVVIGRRSLVFPGKSSNFRHSAVVMMELMLSAKDDTERRLYERVYRDSQHDESLIVPNDADWLLASKILFWLTKRRRRVEGGRLRRLNPGMSQRMALDALLAASARRWKAAVITENWNDFKAIQHFCNVKLVKASDFFK